jgi:hypothetical protein
MDEKSVKKFDPFANVAPKDSVESFAPFCVPEGIAGLWLAHHVPSADREMQVSLGAVFESVIAEGMAKGIKNAMATMEKTPEVGAALASMEADLIELRRAINKKNDEGVNLDYFST